LTLSSTPITLLWKKLVVQAPRRDRAGEPFLKHRLKAFDLAFQFVSGELPEFVGIGHVPPGTGTCPFTRFARTQR